MSIGETIAFGMFAIYALLVLFVFKRLISNVILLIISSGALLLYVSHSSFNQKIFPGGAVQSAIAYRGNTYRIIEVNEADHSILLANSAAARPTLRVPIWSTQLQPLPCVRCHNEDYLEQQRNLSRMSDELTKTLNK